MLTGFPRLEHGTEHKEPFGNTQMSCAWACLKGSCLGALHLAPRAKEGYLRGSPLVILRYNGVPKIEQSTSYEPEASIYYVIKEVTYNYCTLMQLLISISNTITYLDSDCRISS